jgi:hypothetical protein
MANSLTLEMPRSRAEETHLRKVTFYMNFLLRLGAAVLVASSLSASPAHATNIVTFDKDANSCGVALMCGTGGAIGRAAIPPREDSFNTLAPDTRQDQFGTELSAMKWVGCTNGQSCQSAPLSVTSTWLASYGAIATGVNFDVSPSTTTTAMNGAQLNWVTEPASFALLGSMLLGLGFLVWRRLSN